mmetsp:Transcript_133490/g.188594  ORF Transcript_133490/g.188594 Transcript_133490/m.188594 type:complete len:253 (-) Transcript_133490:39-797(-)
MYSAHGSISTPYICGGATRTVRHRLGNRAHEPEFRYPLSETKDPQLKIRVHPLLSSGPSSSSGREAFCSLAFCCRSRSAAVQGVERSIKAPVPCGCRRSTMSASLIGFCSTFTVLITVFRVQIQKGVPESSLNSSQVSKCGSGQYRSRPLASFGGAPKAFRFFSTSFCWSFKCLMTFSAAAFSSSRCVPRTLHRARRPSWVTKLRPSPRNCSPKLYSSACAKACAPRSQILLPQRLSARRCGDGLAKHELMA